MRLLAAIRDAIDSDAIDAAADQIGQALAQRRDAFSLPVVVSERGIRPAFVDRACDRVFARILAKAWEDHAISPEEDAQIREIAALLQLTPDRLRAAGDVAIRDSMRRREGLPPLRPTLGVVLADYWRSILGLPRRLGVTTRPLVSAAIRAQRAAAARSADLWALAEARDRERREVEPEPDMVDLVPSDGHLGPFRWSPPADAASYAVLESRTICRLTDPQRWLAMSLGIEVRRVAPDQVISQLDRIVQRSRENPSARVETLRRQIIATGGRPEGTSIGWLWDQLCARVGAVEIAHGPLLFSLLCAGVSAPRAFSTAEADSISVQLDGRARKAKCNVCGRRFERFYVICYHCDEGCAWHDPWQPRLWKLNPRLGVEWWKA